MKLTPIRTLALLTTLALASTPAFADDHHGRARSNGEAQGRAVQRSAPREAPHAESAPRAEAARPRVEGRRDVVVPHAVPRREVVVPRHDYRDYRDYRAVRPYVARPYYARPYYARPYIVRPYAFRPRLNLGFGIFLGYPVPYAYSYPYPVPVYGYGAPVSPVVVGPGTTQFGGVSLEINPPDAAVYVDGGYAGVVSDFDGSRQPLNLVGGRHHIEINAPGYEPWSFDVDVMPGQVIPYRGDLQPY